MDKISTSLFGECNLNLQAGASVGNKGQEGQEGETHLDKGGINQSKHSESQNGHPWLSKWLTVGKVRGRGEDKSHDMCPSTE